MNVLPLLAIGFNFMAAVLIVIPLLEDPKVIAIAFAASLDENPKARDLWIRQRRYAMGSLASLALGLVFSVGSLFYNLSN